MLSVIVQSVVILSVIMLSAVAPSGKHFYSIETDSLHLPCQHGLHQTGKRTILLCKSVKCGPKKFDNYEDRTTKGKRFDFNKLFFYFLIVKRANATFFVIVLF